ncbi:ankyrin repeats (3 copies) domain-containing protein [Hirsutella rhossiliensis]|uniref:Ankyrin repeats (3 copies) domain-containing protein n=1 Tax=Hirsutella rhossiliensis TaxID=111463 RepID=A0A9P8SDU5_9HYPO|nr:ankyrin repeats (3 copies) domain-containing protein [Hirsutella rhossiliensis]KAH0959118.1 ankyrin repeats (3 copies) domain-containing protein [Hirsutella rhossiliensis]
MARVRSAPSPVNASPSDSDLHSKATHSRVIGLQMSWKQAIEEGNDPALVAVINSCNDMIALVEEESGMTPLHYAAKCGRLEAVRFLLGKRFPLNATDKFGRTPLYMAVLHQQLETVKSLLQNDADPNIRCRCKTSTVSKAAEYGNRAMLRLLREAGAAWNTANVDGESPKELAARNGHVIPWARYEADQHDRLLNAAQEGHVESVRRLVRLGVDPAERPPNSMSALETACEGGKIEVVRFLLCDASVGTAPAFERIKSMGETAIHKATMNGHGTVVRLLLQNGLSPDTRDFDNMTPLHRAAARGHEKVATVLLEYKANINAKGLHGATPLHQAEKQKRTGMIRFLLDRGAN